MVNDTGPRVWVAGETFLLGLDHPYRSGCTNQESEQSTGRGGGVCCQPWDACLLPAGCLLLGGDPGPPACSVQTAAAATFRHPEPVRPLVTRLPTPSVSAHAHMTVLLL